MCVWGCMCASVCARVLACVRAFVCAYSPISNCESIMHRIYFYILGHWSHRWKRNIYPNVFNKPKRFSGAAEHRMNLFLLCSWKPHKTDFWIYLCVVITILFFEISCIRRQTAFTLATDSSYHPDYQHYTDESQNVLMRAKTYWSYISLNNQ